MHGPCSVDVFTGPHSLALSLCALAPRGHRRTSDALFLITQAPAIKPLGIPTDAWRAFCAADTPKVWRIRCAQHLQSSLPLPALRPRLSARACRSSRGQRVSHKVV